MQYVSRIVQCIAEQPVVGLIQQLLKVRQISRAVAATFTASQERVDSFKVRRRCELSLSTRSRRTSALTPLLLLVCSMLYGGDG